MRRTSTCVVRAADYLRHWQGHEDAPEQAPVWSGVERRLGPPDRRITLERRGEMTSGRRRYPGPFDRRKAVAARPDATGDCRALDVTDLMNDALGG